LAQLHTHAAGERRSHHIIHHMHDEEASGHEDLEEASGHEDLEEASGHEDLEEAVSMHRRRQEAGNEESEACSEERMCACAKGSEKQ
jgi:hypothetical protein